MGCSALNLQNVVVAKAISQDQNIQNNSYLGILKTLRQKKRDQRNKKIQQLKNKQNANGQKQRLYFQAYQDFTQAKKFQFDFFKQKEIPDQFCCPITRQIMIQPYQIADGFTYEREAIMTWLKYHDQSPLTRQILKNKQMTENITLKKLIRDFNQKNKKYNDHLQQIKQKLKKQQINMQSIKISVLPKQYFIQKLKDSQEKIQAFKRKLQVEKEANHSLCKIIGFSEFNNTFQKVSSKYSFILELLQQVLQKKRLKPLRTTHPYYIHPIFDSKNVVLAKWKDNQIYLGQWRNNTMNGYGHFQFHNGDKTNEIKWQKGEPVDTQGKYIWKDGTIQYNINYNKSDENRCRYFTLKNIGNCHQIKFFQQKEKLIIKKSIWHCQLITTKKFDNQIRTKIKIARYKKNNSKIEYIQRKYVMFKQNDYKQNKQFF